MGKEIRFTDRNQLYKWLSETDTSNKKETQLSSVYYLIEFNGHIEPLYFMHYEDVYFESPCVLSAYSMSEIELVEYVKDMYEADAFDIALEFEKTMQRGNIHYEIDNPQCSPFLPNEIKILDILSETECLDWLLKHGE